jgi:hypothetical protein
MATTFKVEIDWDHDGTWTDETSRTRRCQIRNGFEQPGDAVAATGRCTLMMDNTDQRFSPGYVSSPLYGNLLPRRQVRVSASDGVSTWTLFRGFIDAIQPDAGRWGGGECVIECVDAVALLAQQRIGVVHEDTKAVDDAVSAVVAAAYTPPAASYSDNGDTLTHYGRSWQPEETTCLAALREIAEAVYGRFYVARDGTATYLSRDDRQNSSLPASVLIGDIEYWQRVKEMRAASLVAYWRLNESTGTTAGDSSGNGYSGTAYGVTWSQAGIGDGDTAALFDGVNDYVNVYSAGLRDAFSSGEGTLMIWVRVADAGVWTDGAYRTFVNLEADGNNFIRICKHSLDHWLQWLYRAGGVDKQVNKGNFSATGWLCLGLTWDTAADQARAYLNGAQEDQPMTGLGTWAGSLATAVIGAVSSTPGEVFNGRIAHVALWSEALTGDEIAQLAGV